MNSEHPSNPILYGIVGTFSSIFVYLQSNPDIMENILEFIKTCGYGFMGGLLWALGKQVGENWTSWSKWLKEKSKEKCK